MMKSRLTLIAGALCLIWNTASMAAPLVGGEAHIEQTGSGGSNDASITQTQSSTVAKILQNGSDENNQASILQEGMQVSGSPSVPHAAITQSGSGAGANFALIEQRNYGQIHAYIRQESQQGNAEIYQLNGSSNNVLIDARIDQSSPASSATINQDRLSDSGAFIVQSGADKNIATISQGVNQANSSGLSASITQVNNGLGGMFGHRLVVSQDGTNQSAIFDLEIGATTTPEMFLYQTGEANVFSVTQFGSNNTLSSGASISIYQTGNSSVTVLQNGVDNTVTQFGQSGGGDNELSITQEGNNNLAGILQAGSFNTGLISQTGVDHIASIAQTGAGHYASITQAVEGNEAFIVQDGVENMAASITQLNGTDNYASISQYIEKAVAIITQDLGSNNTATIVQQ